MTESLQAAGGAVGSKKKLAVPTPDEKVWAAVAEAIKRKQVESEPTVRAVEVIERHAKTGEWLKVDARTLLGTEQEAEQVNADEYCVPELPKPADMLEYMAVVEKLVRESKFLEPGSKERYMEIMRKHYGAYCVRLEQFVPGRLDMPKLKLVARPGRRFGMCGAR